MEYMGIGHRVKVTYKDHKDFDKEGIIHSKNGEFVVVNFGTHRKQHNVSNLLDLSLNDVCDSLLDLSEKTFVVFLKHDNDLYAFFPEVEAHMYVSESKECYSHIGQHSTCTIDYARQSTLATKEEYSDLQKELESLGYKLALIKEF